MTTNTAHVDQEAKLRHFSFLIPSTMMSVTFDQERTV